MEQNSVKVGGYEKPSDIGVAMLSKQLEVSEASGASLIRAMELSVNPAVGANFDMYV
ncbi:MAG: YjfB family protein [Eubacterium sp.]|nr:YjfB family protein [Eubacterium sp.]